MQHKFDVLIVGAGPAGMAAAVRAAEYGASVGIVDDNATLGGQIWRQGIADGGSATNAATWRDRLQTRNVTMLCGKRVFHQPDPGVLLAEGEDELLELSYRSLVLATGARERFLPFPGWTLPNVMGAGGLQAMVKEGLPIQGKRVVVAGTGPLLLAVAAYLKKAGAAIPIICEQASRMDLARFAMSLASHPRKIAEALRLKKHLGGFAFVVNSWPLAVHGQRALESVTISRNGRSENVKCDYLACGFHLVPNTELPAFLGCRIRDGFVHVDDFQRTTMPDIFCAGEPTCIGGLELSLVEGQIAGVAASGRTAEAQQLFAEREKWRRFAHILDQAFGLRPELRSLPSEETIICRCEDVPYSRLKNHTSWRAAKLHTRCGMGACQGRICGPATQFLFHWSPDSVRPPIFPARVDNLAPLAGTAKSGHNAVAGGLG